VKNILGFECYDAHVHVGQYKKYYFTPDFIVNEMRSLRIKKWIVISTSSCNLNYDFGKIKSEIDEMLYLAPEEAFPLLWIRPDMLEKSPDLSMYKHKYYGFKIHGYIQNWDAVGKPLNRVFSIAKERNLPILMHTGGKKECEPKSYLSVCKKFPSVKVVLAHGRPIDQVETVFRECANCYVDTAFMPVEDISRLILNGYAGRILFGSDHPIGIAFNSDKKSKDIYNDNLIDIKNNIEQRILISICNSNIKKVFNII
jgi:hypothetical protein